MFNLIVGNTSDAFTVHLLNKYTSRDYRLAYLARKLWHWRKPKEAARAEVHHDAVERVAEDLTKGMTREEVRRLVTKLNLVGDAQTIGGWLASKLVSPNFERVAEGLDWGISGSLSTMGRLVVFTSRLQLTVDRLSKEQTNRRLDPFEQTWKPKESKLDRAVGFYVAQRVRYLLMAIKHCLSSLKQCALSVYHLREDMDTLGYCNFPFRMKNDEVRHARIWHFISLIKTDNSLVYEFLSEAEERYGSEEGSLVHKFDRLREASQWLLT